VGLIAREIEGKGVSTLSLSSAFSITRSANPPRALFLDFPLGHTAGRAGDAVLQDAIIEAALVAFETMRAPGSIMRLPFRWADDDAWKNSVMRPRAEGDQETHRDDRSERSGDPQYQCEADRVAAERADS
jgi:hypothetical protein